MTSFILASRSAARTRMLTDAGVSFDTLPANIDEAALKAALLADRTAPRDIADALAEAKAVRISARRPEALVLGSDQILHCEGRIFDKPSDISELRDHLHALRGRTHELISAAVCAERGQPVWRAITTARLTMRPFSSSFVDTYVEMHGRACLSSVGGYQIEAGGAQLFARIEGEPFTIMGLPLLELLEFLRVRGIAEE